MGPHIDFYLLLCSKFQVLDNLHQLYNLVLQLLVQVLNQKMKLISNVQKLKKYSLNSYVIHSLQNKDLLYILAYMCKCLCDFGLHNQHWQHSHKDQHTSHCDRQELWDTLGLSNTHKAYTLHKDFLCAQVDTDTWLCVCLLYRRL